jgi:hypothetical protein
MCLQGTYLPLLLRMDTSIFQKFGQLHEGLELMTTLYSLFLLVLDTFVSRKALPILGFMTWNKKVI